MSLADEEKRTAVALGYEAGDEAPRILATGRGHLADRIIEEARKADVPIHRDAALARTLSSLDYGECIPPELYEVVVDVLTYVDKVDEVRARMESGPDRHH